MLRLHNQAAELHLQNRRHSSAHRCLDAAWPGQIAKGNCELSNPKFWDMHSCQPFLHLQHAILVHEKHLLSNSSKSRSFWYPLIYRLRIKQNRLQVGRSSHGALLKETHQFSYPIGDFTLQSFSVLSSSHESASRPPTPRCQFKEAQSRYNPPTPPCVLTEAMTCSADSICRKTVSDEMGPASWPGSRGTGILREKRFVGEG